MTLTRHPDLQSLIPPLAAEEYAQLDANILAEGCRDPLVVWQEEQILLDGHNRLDICERHGLSYTIVEVSLPDLDAAKAWMITNQIGRRNLTPEQMSYFRGEQYNIQKRQGKRTDLPSPHSEEKLSNTSYVLAAQHKVGHATIERDGAYAAAVESLAAVLGPEARQAVLGGDLKLTKRDVQALASLVALTPESVPTMQDALRSADPGPTLQAMARTARCDICHRPLSDPASISRGIGPVCAGHGNGAREGSGGGARGGLAVSPSAPVALSTAARLAGHVDGTIQRLETLAASMRACAFPPPASTQFWIVAKGTKTRWPRQRCQLAGR